MEKSECDCKCHELHPIPCELCAGRHGYGPDLSDDEAEPVEPPPPQSAAPFDADLDHDGKTEPHGTFSGYPF